MEKDMQDAYEEYLDIYIHVALGKSRPIPSKGIPQQLICARAGYDAKAPEPPLTSEQFQQVWKEAQSLTE